MEPANARKRISVATILIAGIVVFSTLILLALGAIFWSRERAQRLVDFERHAQSTADQLATALSYPIWNYDEDYVNRILKGALEDGDIAAVQLIRRSLPELGYTLEEGRGLARTFSPPTSDVFPEHREITYENHRIGSLELRYSTRSIKEADAKSLGFLVGLILAFNVLLVLGLYLLLWRFTLKPLRQIENYALAVSRSANREGRHPPPFWGELETVRSSIERMVGELNARLEKIQQSERKFHSIFNGTSDAIVVRLSPGGQNAPEPLVEVNDVACEKFGYTRDEFLALTIDRLFADPESARKLRGQGGRYNARCLKSDGVEMGFEILEQTIEIDGMPHTILAGRDTSERENLEENLRQAHKMEAVGRLAGGIAHDFNNLLTAILGYCEILELERGLSARHRDYIGHIKSASNRAAALTRQLLAFSRKQILQPKLISLKDVVAETHKILERILGEDIDLKLATTEEEGYVYADPGQLNQVLMNLTINARDAMPDGGTLTLRIANVKVEEGDRGRSSHLPPGDYVELSVTDTGTGMDEGTIQNLFEPFFTTKGVGKGTGLGLATVHGIVVQSGGHIRVESTRREGSTFRIYLPRRLREEEVAQTAETAPASMVGGAETILLVEDSTEVRSLAKGVLTNLGYRVLEASRGEEAEELAEKYEGTIHLLLTDVVMPGISGQMLAQRLAKTRPAMKIFYMSGYTENAIVHHGVLDEGVSFLQKPFRPSDLAARVREVLNKVRG